eukprot:CAMPEP_0196591750 /NCGR_PEP_ID=MMETSP1081-20130531/70770_1 /TAXON_ID=36882 /ORGANISM="Pyramimonas amylifera, Strain CCMP720" /LENGTH=129 /DNA_ID=CAMNT_0041915219 /DNA_START=183 /DNA_END=573 /DNA_ORIENTATION=-
MGDTELGFSAGTPKQHHLELMKVWPQLDTFSFTNIKNYSSFNYQKEVDLINDKFAEARDEIEMATEDAETVYFNESAETAREVTKDALDRWAKLLLSVDEETKNLLQRSMGLKMQQLKAELEQLDHLHE